MTDCEYLGHPLLNGVECPCGQRHHPTRREMPQPTPRPDPRTPVTMHLSRQPRRPNR